MKRDLVFECQRCKERLVATPVSCDNCAIWSDICKNEWGHLTINPAFLNQNS